MRVNRSFPALVAVALLFAGTAADAFTSRNGARVNPVDKVVFEVVPRNASTGPDIWCAASEYAQIALKAPWTAKLYIARGRGPSVTTNRRTAVQFTLDPAAAGVTPVPSGLSMNSLKAGESMSVQLAGSYCVTPTARF